MFDIIKNYFANKNFNSDEFTHVLVSRFNVEVWKQFSANQEVLRVDPNWIENRLNLLETYCLPSVNSQTNKNFTWLVYFNINTPDIYKQKILGYKKICPMFNPVFIEPSIENNKKNTKYLITNAIKEHIDTNKWVLTTRIDSDDVMAKDYIDTIQKQFEPKDKLFIDFYKGYKIDTKTNKLYNFDFKSNPFMSCVEKPAGFVGILRYNHMEINKYGTIKRIEDKPMWIQVIHGENMVNNLDNTSPCESLNDFNQRFEILVPVS